MPPRVKWKEFIHLLMSEDWRDADMKKFVRNDMPGAFSLVMMGGMTCSRTGE